MEEGDFVPAERLVRPLLYQDKDWDALAMRARSRPGEMMFVAEKMPPSRIQSFRTLRRPAFRDNEGYIHVSTRNSFVGDDGVRYADVFFTFVPTEKEEG